VEAQRSNRDFNEWLGQYLAAIKFTEGSQRFERYLELLREIYHCERCYRLGEKLVLPGTGNLDCPAGIMLVGEAPSVYRTFHETFGMRSKPVVDMMLRMLGVTRDDVWMTNVVKCIRYSVDTGKWENCWWHLLEEVDIIRPKVIILMGRTAVRALLKSDLPLSGTRWGIVIKGRPYTVYTCYHPMVAVYNPAKIQIIYDTVKKIAEDLHQKRGLEQWLT